MRDHITVGHLAEYILDNRKDKAFVGDTFVNLCAGLEEDIHKGCLLYVCDDKQPNEPFTGVVSFTPDFESKKIFVRNIVVTKHSALVIFVRHFSHVYTDYTIEAMRDNEFIKYNTHRLINLLTVIKGKE